MRLNILMLFALRQSSFTIPDVIIRRAPIFQREMPDASVASPSAWPDDIGAVCHAQDILIFIGHGDFAEAARRRATPRSRAMASIDVTASPMPIRFAAIKRIVRPRFCHFSVWLDC